MPSAFPLASSPSVSVVMPTYNYGRFLARALDSVLGQTYCPAEIIVVDDGSTDETPDVLAKYASPVRAVRQMNRGLSCARNVGISLARGDLVALIDSDDTWDSEKLARQVALWLRHPDSGAVGCGVRVVDANGDVIRELRFEDATGSARQRIRGIALRRQWVGGSGSGALIPAAVLRAVGGFDEALGAAEDWDMWLRIAARFPVRNVPEPLARIWDHRSGTFRNVAKLASNQMSVLRKLSAREGPDLDRAILRKVHALILSDAAGEAFGSGDWRASAAYATRSIARWPFSWSTWRLLAGSSRHWLTG